MDAIDGYGNSSSSDDDDTENRNVTTTTDKPVSHNKRSRATFDPKQEDTPNRRKRPHVQIWTEQQARQQELFSRNEPHVRGNWAGLVYLSLEEAAVHDNGNHHPTNLNDQCDDDDDRSSVSSSMQLAQQEWNLWKQDGVNRVLELLTNPQQRQEQQSAVVKGQGQSAVVVVKESTDHDSKKTSSSCLVTHDSPHVSLTRPFFLQNAFIPSFLDRLKQLANNNQPLHLNISSRITTLVNDHQTRMFFAWPATVMNESDKDDDKDDDDDKNGSCKPAASLLQSWVLQLNQLLKVYQQPPYYDPPQFHASFASMPLAENDDGQQLMNQVLVNNKNLDDKSNDNNDNEILELVVKQISCRIGDQVHSFQLGG